MRQVKLTYHDVTFELETILEWFIKVFYVVFLYFAMYSRAQGLLGFSGGMTAALMSGGIFFLSVVYSYYLKEDYVISQLVYFILIFFASIAISPVFSAFIFDFTPSIALNLIVEVGVIACIFLATYNFIRAKLISPKFFLYAIAFLGFFAALTILKNLGDSTKIWRVRTSIGGGNYIATTIGMSAVSWVMILYSNTFEERGGKKYNKLKLVCFILTLLAMILTGTRSATIGFIVGMGALMLFGFRRENLKKYFLITAISFGIIFVIIIVNFDASILLERYSMEEIMRMARIRFSLYTRSVTDLTMYELFIGRPDLYIFSSGLDGARMVNTHNIFLSLIRYHGVFVFTVFVLLMIAIIFNYLKLYKNHSHLPLIRFTEASIIVFLIMAIVYTMFSGGRPTRDFSLFVSLGYFAGYFELLKNVNSVEEYKKMIL